MISRIGHYQSVIKQTEHKAPAVLRTRQVFVAKKKVFFLSFFFYLLKCTHKLKQQ
jgi:hypothetical protein